MRNDPEFGAKAFIGILMVIAVVLFFKVQYDQTTWTVAHSGTFDRVEYLATKGGDTIIYFADGTSWKMGDVLDNTFKKGDQLIIKQNGLGYRIVEKFQPEGSQDNKK